MAALPDAFLYYTEQHEEWVREEHEMLSYAGKKEGTMEDGVQADVFEAMLALAKQTWTLPENVRLCEVDSYVRIFLAPFYSGHGLLQEEIALKCYPICVGVERWDCFMGYGPKSLHLAWRVKGPFSAQDPEWKGDEYDTGWGGNRNTPDVRWLCSNCDRPLAYRALDGRWAKATNVSMRFGGSKAAAAAWCPSCGVPNEWQPQKWGPFVLNGD